jgi:hypothetical protein
MAKVILDSWREGLKKVSLTKLQVNMLGKPLTESKSNVDSLLDGKKVIIEIESLDLANEFLKEAQKVGVNCELVIDCSEVILQSITWWEKKRLIYNKILMIVLFLLLTLKWDAVVELWNYQIGIIFFILLFFLCNIVFLAGWVFEVLLIYYFNKTVLNIWLRLLLFISLVTVSTLLAVFMMFEFFAVVFPLE